jgi:Tfp pilus assembly protein PilN
MRAVNLLPKDAGRGHAKPRNTVAIVGAGTGVAVTAILCGGFLMQASKVKSAQQALDQAKMELAATPKPPPVDPAQTQLSAEKTARIAALSTALGTREPLDRVLREFSQVLPDDVWLQSLTLDAPAAGTPPTPGSAEFKIAGYTYSHDAVARLLSRLAVIPDLQNVQLGTSSLAKLGSQSIVTFNIAADLKRASASQ